MWCGGGGRARSEVIGNSVRVLRAKQAITKYIHSEKSMVARSSEAGGLSQALQLPEPRLRRAALVHVSRALPVLSLAHVI